MALAFRLIARLDVRNEHLIKTIRCEGVRKVGDPAEYARKYDQEGIDEILYIDTVASLYGRNGIIPLTTRTADSCFVPLCVAGRISSTAEVATYLRRGADKIAINTGALDNPSILGDLAQKFGSQAVTLQLDAKAKNGGWEAYTHGGRHSTGRCALAWAAEAVDRGCGEILVTSIDREGTRAGFAYDLVYSLASSVRVPVVAAGGFGAPPDAVKAYQAGASGIAIAGALHYNRVTLEEIRAHLRQAGIPTR